MTTPDTRRVDAAQLPKDDMIAMLLEQHARLQELFTEVKQATGQRKQDRFNELRALLVVHETAEEMILRPVAKQVAPSGEADARNEEEAAATRVLASLEKMDVNSAEFDAHFAQLERSVLEHAEHEERDEFPSVRASRPEDELKRMGTQLKTAEKIAPTHPHPSTAGSPTAQWTVGPLASLIDRAKDAISSSR